MRNNVPAKADTSQNFTAFYYKFKCKINNNLLSLSFFGMALACLINEVERK